MEMVETNQEIFNVFMDLHDKYTKDPVKWQNDFNTTGKKIVEIIREWERKLCSHSERGKFAKFSDKLAEKFWSEVRKDFPKIDFVGVTIK